MDTQSKSGGPNTGIHCQPRIVVIGMGNDHRADDSVGLIVARELAAKHLPGVEIVAKLASNLDLLTAWEAADVAILVDAMDLGRRTAESIQRFEYPNDFFFEDIPEASTHSLSLSCVVELAEALDQLPGRLIVYGIAGRRFTIGAVLSSAVARAVDETLRLIIEEIRSLRHDSCEE